MVQDGLYAEKAWHRRIGRKLSTQVAVLHLLGPFVQMVFVGHLARFQASIFIIGLLLLVVGHLDRLSYRVRSALLLALLSTSVAVLFLHSGYAPVFAAAYLLLMVVAGLLSGKIVMGLVIVALPAVFVLSGYAIEMGWLHYSTEKRDPNIFRNWARITVFYSATTICMLLIISDLSRYISRTHAGLKQRQSEVKQSRSSMAATRNARIAAEHALREGQQRESISRLGRGLTQHLEQRLTEIRGLLDAGVNSHSMPERRALSAAVRTAFLPTMQIINDLMTLSRFNGPSRSGESDLSTIVETACRSMGAGQSSRTTTIQSQLTPGLVVLGSQSVVQQAVLNLLLNALEATPAGTIQVSTVYAQPINGVIGHAMLVVEDTGHGITSADLALIFEPFFSTRSGQTGLGLSVAHAIAEQNGGGLKIESAPAVGTRASLTFALRQSVDLSTLPTVDTSWLRDDLHAKGTLRSADDLHDLSPPTIDDSMQPAGLSSWRLDFARKLARIGGVLGLLVLCTHLSLAPRLHLSTYLTIVPVIMLILWVGWSATARPALLYGALFYGVFLASMVSIAFNSFDNPVAMIGITIPIAWSVLLGRHRSTALMMVGLVAGFLGTGWLREHYWALPKLDNLNINVSATWYRMAPQVFILLLALGVSVVGVIERLRLSMERTASALKQAEKLRQHEAREARQLVALEAHRSHQQRIEATGRLAGALAHDLRNTLQLVLHIEVIEMEALPADAVAEVLSDVYTGLKDAEAISAQLRTSPEKDAEDHQENCHLEAQVRQTMRHLTQHLPQGIQIELDIMDCGEVALAPTDIRRVLNNLINNSCDAMLGEGSIRVSLRKTEASAELLIQDSGAGVETSIQDQIFDAYFSTKPNTTGTGLGLHAVQSIMSRCGGQIGVESSPGAGATFRLVFPVQPAC